MDNRFQIIDPTIDIRRRVAEINRGVPPEAVMDDQEIAEREEAARAYAGESESHFVRFLDDCVQSSVEAMTEIRANQQECWDVYNELEPANFAFKEAWQTRVTVPKPYSSCQFAQAIVRKAFDTQFLSIENERDKEAADFWGKLMELMLSRNYANFPINFTDATGMSFAIGQSMEMIPVWRPGKGLRYILTEPWKIHRDPDAISRQPQSGMFWVHQEWLDYYTLKQAQDDGRYINIGDIGPGGSWGNPKGDINLTQEEIARRKGMLWNRSTFRTMALTSEFWGTILSPKGEMLMPNATFTVAGDRVISLPKASPYSSLRWPGIGFSALPHLLRFDGRGLIQGIKSLWYFMNSLLCLHADNLNWTVNPMTETDISSLVDQSDVDIYPGKNSLTRGTVNGQPVVRTVDRRSNTGDILANMNFADQRAQEGMMLNYAAQGLPGYRAEVTAREAAQNLDQSMTVFGLIGKNLEDGALNAIMAGAETVALNISYDELAFLMGQDVAEKYRNDESPTGLTLPQLSTGAFHVSGISALMRDQEIVNAISKMIIPLFDPNGLGQVFSGYLKPYNLLKALESRLNLKDEAIIVPQEAADRIDEAQQAQQEAAIEAQKQKEAAEAEQAQNASLNEVSQAHLNLQEAGAHAAKAELSRAQAEAATHQADVHDANAELARQNAIQVAQTPPPQPGVTQGGNA